LIKANPDLKEADELRFYYYNYIAESYNRNFGYSYQFTQEISSLSRYLNPALSEPWKNENAETEIFEGFVHDNTKGVKKIKIPYLQQSFFLQKSKNHDNFKVGSTQKVTLHFYLRGIVAKLMNGTNGQDKKN
jgi:hypothetical protein